MDIGQFPDGLTLTAMDRLIGWRRKVSRCGLTRIQIDHPCLSPAVGVRWFRRAGGIAPSHLSINSKSLSGRYLSLAEREEIAILHSQKRGVCEIARQLGRAASTISRELRRNAATRAGGLEYRATTALTVWRFSTRMEAID